MRHVATAMMCVLLLAASLPARAQNPVYGKDYIIVTPGMTLTRVMREFYPTRRGQWAALMDEIITTNPHAFVNGAPASMKLGMRITLPGARRAATTTAVAPSTNVQRLTVTGATAAATTTRAATASASGNVTRRTTTTPRVATGTARAAPATATASGNVARSVATSPTVATGASTRYVPNPDPTRKHQSSTSVAMASTTTTTAAASGATTSARVGTFTVTPAQPPTSTIPLPSQDLAAAANLPEPVSAAPDDSNLDASTQPKSAKEESSSERPPWWWIGSALLVIVMIL